MIKRFFKPLYLCVFIAIIFFGLLIISPQKCKDGTAYGIMLSGSVIIPSFFPFTVCVLFILRTGILDRIPLSDKFSVMVMSFIGGYPLGAKTVSEMYRQNKITERDAGLMLCYCVNAGPSFIISAVGAGMLNSKTIGYILLASHITASLITALIIKLFFGKNKKNKINKNDDLPNLSDVFVTSVADGASAVFSICTFVILFCAINSYILSFAQKFQPIKYLIYITEVTTASAYTKNIYLISFMLSFAGLCIWCQVFSCFANTNVKMLPFIISRFFNGLISSVIVYVIIKITNVSLPTISNSLNFTKKISFSGVELSVALFCMILLLMISLSRKKYSGKLLDDMV